MLNIMKTKLLLALILSLFLSVSSMAGHMAGGEITYKYLGNEKYEVTFKVYRDCRGGSITNINFKVLWVGKNYQRSIYPTLVSIRDISNVCRSWANTCSPSNTTIKSSAPIFEEFTYAYQLDFNNAEVDFKKACLLQIGMGECCRSSGMTTGGAGNNFWVTCNIDLCKNPKNSSPVFSFPPNFTICCNQSAYMSFNALDTLDNDSLSYRFVNPLQTFTDTVKWANGRTYKSPIYDYWPSGYDKNKGPNPSANPVIGTYLDQQSGILYFTPTDCSELTKLAVAVREWRKDSTGTYKIIGEVIRDISLNTISCPDNNPPLIYGKESYTICEGENLKINFTTDDKQFYPPPPQKPRAPDTTFIKWSSGIKGAKFIQSDDSIRLKTGSFTWNPPVGSGSSMPYYFSLRVNDNACNINGVAYKTISITVNKIMKINHELQKLKDNLYVGKGGMDTSYGGNYWQSWQVLDSFGNSIRTVYSNSNRYSLFHILKPSSSKPSSDTFVFLRNGKYIISHQINANGYCPKAVLDSVLVKNIPFEVSILSVIDTSVCKFTKLKLTAKVIGGKGNYQYTWKKDGKILPDTIAYVEHDGLVNAFYKVEVKDSTGQMNSSFLYIGTNPLPNIRKANDTLVCPDNGIRIKAKPLTKYEYISKWQWLKDGIVFSSSDSLKTKISGTYIVKAENYNGCISYDTIMFGNFPNTKPELINGKYCQNKYGLKQNEIILSPSNLKGYTKMEWTVVKSLNDRLGNLNPVDSLIRDLDTSAGYDFNVIFGKSSVDLGTSKKDSLKFVLAATDSFKCQSKDTMILEILKSPEIVAVKNQSYCRNDAIDLIKKITSNLPVKIMAENHTGYDDWPLEGEIINGIIKQKYFKPDGGGYFVGLSAENEMCTAMDSISLTINPNPVAVVDVQLLGDSVIFNDNSKYSTSRNWYLNNVLKSSDKKYVLTRTAAHLKPIKLELKNLNCSFDTTFSVKTLVVKNQLINPIKIYPNPNSGNFVVEIDKPEKSISIEVFNSIGEKMPIKIGTVEASVFTIELNVEAGIYLVKLKNGEMIYYQKVNLIK